MKLGFLRWIPENAKFPFTKWATIAAQAGIEFEYIRTRPSNFTGSEIERRNFVDKASRLLEEADAFIVPYSTNYADLTPVHERVRQGARLVYMYQFSEQSFRSSEAFLAHYDMAPTGKRILSGRLGSDEWLIKLNRDAGCFWDSFLFRGVEEVVISNAYLLWPVDNASLILTATDECWVFQQGEDLPDFSDLRRYFKNALNAPPELLEKFSLPEGWTVQELACAAVQYNENKGAVLAIAGDIFSDPGFDMGGRRYPGIEKNEQLARNVLDFLFANDTSVGPRALVERIEVNLADFVRRTLKELGGNWWTDYIPENIQRECARKRKRKGNRYPPESYLGLIDLKSIMDKQWSYFEPAFRTVGLEGGKEKCLAWMDRLNEIRTMVAHPLKRHFAAYKFPPEDRAFLAHWHALVLKLKESRV